MSNYYNPTIVQQAIPASDMTALERLLLGHIFDMTTSEYGELLRTVEGPETTVCLPAADLRRAIDDKAAQGSFALRQVLDQFSEGIDGDEDVEIDLSDEWWLRMLQDIVRRSATLDHVSIVSSYESDRMRFDGCGGDAVLVTATMIRCESTNEVLARFIAEAVEAGEMQPLD